MALGAGPAAYDLWWSGGPRPPERGVLPVTRDELVVAAQLGDAAVDDDGDAVGVVRGVQAVRDGDDGPAGQQGVSGHVDHFVNAEL